VSILTVLECSRRRTPCGFAEIFGSVLQSGKGGYIFIYCGLPWSLSLGSLLLLERKRIRKTTQAAKAIPHIKLRKVSHSGTEYRKLLYRQTKKAQSERSNRIPEGGKKSQRDWSTSLK